MKGLLRAFCVECNQIWLAVDSGKSQYICPMCRADTYAQEYANMVSNTRAPPPPSSVIEIQVPREEALDFSTVVWSRSLKDEVRHQALIRLYQMMRDGKLFKDMITREGYDHLTDHARLQSQDFNDSLLLILHAQEQLNNMKAGSIDIDIALWETVQRYEYLKETNLFWSREYALTKL